MREMGFESLGGHLWAILRHMVGAGVLHSMERKRNVAFEKENSRCIWEFS